MSCNAFCFTGERLADLFPLSDLTSVDDLRPLFENASVTFLLRACYEHLSTNGVTAVPMES